MAHGLRGVVRALQHARKAIISVALLYALSVTVGAVMVQAGYQPALSYRDSMVNTARATDSVFAALDSGDRLGAALLDFYGNLVLGAVPNTLGGLGVVFPYPLVAFRGWVGGIVSVNDAHVSRLATFNGGTYYLITLLLQLVPYSLSTGAGVNLGLSLWRKQPYYEGEKWLGFPKEAVLDVLRIYAVVIPLFLAASLFEFLAVG
jgi:uncharacterized membrane protein SpoIIM required for sporulation